MKGLYPQLRVKRGHLASPSGVGPVLVEVRQACPPLAQIQQPGQLSPSICFPSRVS